jgi:predicted nucleic acid-binding protein
MALRATLDTRFFFAYFNPTSERQANWCRSVIKEIGRAGSLAIVSVVTISELYEQMGRLIGTEAVAVRIASMKARKILFIEVDEEIASEAGKIKLSNAEIPLADAIVAATAKQYAPNIYSDDEHFTKIKGVRSVWTE